MSLEGKVAIISGGSRGIGRAIVLDLLRHGAKVAFTYNNTVEYVDEIMEESRKNNTEAKGYQIDVRNQDDVKRMVADVVERWNTIDIIVNNAGIKKDKTLAFMTNDEWKDVLDVNLYGTFYLTQAGIYHMFKKRKGKIINISSISGINGIAGQTNYSTSKAGIIGFTCALAKEVAPYGIAVNAVAPSGVETDMIKNMNSKAHDKMAAAVPMGRFCLPSEVAQLVTFLADDDICPAYLTGTVIPLDGGMST